MTREGTGDQGDVGITFDGPSFDDARHVRDTLTQTLFREVNEHIAELQRSRMFIEFACECCDKNCAESVVVTIDEYEAVRHCPTRFIVAPDHVAGPCEPVVEKNDRYAIVEIRGDAASVAVMLDPRATGDDPARA